MRCYSDTIHSAKVGRTVKTYTKLLTEDTGLQLEDLHKAMDDRAEWIERVHMVQAFLMMMMCDSKLQ